MTFKSLFISLFLLIFSDFLCPCLLSAKIEQLVPKIIQRLPHDPTAFTQGLAIENDQLYESTGLYGQSSLRLVDPLTGNILKKVSLPAHFFAEGIAVFPRQIIQLTWREEKALIYDSETFLRIGDFPYLGEGWGLCRDEDTLWMSNGSAILTQRDARTFGVLKTIEIKMDGRPVTRLNDLECVGSSIYANIWYEDILIRINKETGDVDGLIDASALLSIDEKSSLNSEAVFNGIAYHPKRQTFFVTGKCWPILLEVKFVSG